jgi:hypothetical protein
MSNGTLTGTISYGFGIPRQGKASTCQIPFFLYPVVHAINWWLTGTREPFFDLTLWRSGVQQGD